MTHVEFDKLVKRVEKEAASRLWLYELKLRILALLGYGYITGILTIILVLLLLMWSLLLFVPELNVTASRVAFGLVSAYVLFRLARIFLIRFPPPGGMEVYPEQLPQLFEMVDRLQEEFRSPPVHHIVLTPEFNAAMMYRPRIGPFRKSRNYLILGLPLFFGLSQPEFTAVVAHELGHLSYEHGKFGAYIYRIRERWYRLMESFGQRKGGIGALFTWFFSWYAPYFGAYSFVEVVRESTKLIGEQLMSLTQTGLPVHCAGFQSSVAMYMKSFGHRSKKNHISLPRSQYSRSRVCRENSPTAPAIRSPRD